MDLKPHRTNQYRIFINLQKVDSRTLWVPATVAFSNSKCFTGMYLCGYVPMPDFRCIWDYQSYSCSQIEPEAFRILDCAKHPLKGWLKVTRFHIGTNPTFIAQIPHYISTVSHYIPIVVSVYNPIFGVNF